MAIPVRSLRLLPQSQDRLNALTGNRGEIFYDRDANNIRIYDGVSTGGRLVGQTEEQTQDLVAAMFAGSTSNVSVAYNDSTGKLVLTAIIPVPEEFSGDYNNLINTPTLAPVATSGSYDDLINKPSLPTLANVATSGDYLDLINPPTLFSGNYNDLINKPNLFSGSFNDLTDVPPGGSFSGSYNDLTDKPTIPSLTGYATESFVGTAISNLVDAAPGALDTLNELAAALNDDANFSASVTLALQGKEPLITSGTTSQYFRGDKSFQTLNANAIGLGNVTNESKATMFSSPTFTGTVSGVTATHVGLGNVTNESKATMFSSPTFTGTVSGVTATHVGLGNVTNESKATMFSSPTFTGTTTATGFLQSSRAVVAPNKITYKGTGTLAGLALPTILTSGQSPYGIAVDPSGRFVYAVHIGNSTIGKYLINQTTGNADSYPTFYATGATPAEVAVDPTGRFLYVTNRGAATVSQYSIDQTTGVLTSITTAIASGTSPQGIAVDPTGRFVYVTCWGNNSISQYSINQTTGALTQITTAIGTGTTPWGVAVDPTGRFVYVTINGAGTISQYSINQTTGALTQITTAVAAGSSPRGITADPTGRFVYVACIEPGLFLGAVKQYSINQTTGALTEIVTAIEAGAEPYGIAVDPTGRFVYTVSQNSGSVSQYSINQTTGVLTGTTAVAAGSNPHEIAIDPTGRFVYVTNQSANTISQFSIDNFSVGSISVSGSLTVSGTVSGVTASMVGLGNVTNESKATMFTSPTFTGTVSGVTASMVGLGNVTNESKATMFANPTFTGTVSGVTASMVGLGNVTNESKATMFSSPTFTGTTTLQQSTEVLNTKTAATGVVVHDFSTGAVWVHSGISANFTANFTNVPTTNDRVINIVLALVQGATPYIPNAVQIAGAAQTINWQGGSAPSGNASKRDLVSFTLARTGSAWTVLGSLTTYG